MFLYEYSISDVRRVIYNSFRRQINGDAVSKDCALGRDVGVKRIERNSNIAVWAGLFAGLFAALLTIVVPPVVRNFGLGIFIGTIFGVVISIYFWIVLRTRSVAKTIGFVMASTLAFALAQNSAVFSADFIGFTPDVRGSHGTMADRAPCWRSLLEEQ